ncbi:MAG: AAA family ATPase [Rhodocyclaceae bacterium]|nr:AAA family ATPase [Rhodocyclaceae bacterium]MBX3678031.1 AAA family ATPase [Rhodocyclaceae bacterium]
MGRVIYLTGAPAAGKSTLCANIQQRTARLLVFSYSALLRDHIRRRHGADIDTVELREKSSSVATREDVMVVDARLIDEVNAKRNTHDILIDSHPVTNESYGFRVTPFRADQVSAFSPDAIVCLYASPVVLHQRISMNPDGRPLPSIFELEMHIHVQAALATQYSINVGRSCYLVDSSVSPQELVDTAWPILRFDPR